MSQEIRREKIAAHEAEIARLQEEILAERKALGEDPTVSPFAPAAFPSIPPVAGVRFAAVNAGVRYTTGRLDVMLAEMAPGTVLAGTFTTSKTRSAPVLWCEDRRRENDADPSAAQAIIVNAGNANAFTGRSGADTVHAVMTAAGNVLDIPATNCWMASTGVIGEPLPAERITVKLQELKSGLTSDGIVDAAQAIMTTDTFPKGASRIVRVGGVDVTISGIAKGSGMIAPDMATMLVFIFTDAAIERNVLQGAVSELTDSSFNSITVDSDTSTSDTLLVGATGAAGNPVIETAAHADYRTFSQGLGDVMRELAQQVVKDGEGASKFAAITVTGAENSGAARRIGLAIANSPLVKTAFAGEDPNWGRIVMAVGKSGEQADRDRLAITFGDITVAENGWVADSYSEEAGADYMRRAELEIGVDVGIGSGTATVWTCDLTHGYITINADYRS